MCFTYCNILKHYVTTILTLLSILMNSFSLTQSTHYPIINIVESTICALFHYLYWRPTRIYFGANVCIKYKRKYVFVDVGVVAFRLYIRKFYSFLISCQDLVPIRISFIPSVNRTKLLMRWERIEKMSHYKILIFGGFSACSLSIFLVD